MLCNCVDRGHIAVFASSIRVQFDWRSFRHRPLLQWRLVERWKKNLLQYNRYNPIHCSTSDHDLDTTENQTRLQVSGRTNTANCDLDACAPKESQSNAFGGNDRLFCVLVPVYFHTISSLFYLVRGLHYLETQPTINYCFCGSKPVYLQFLQHAF